MCAYGNETINIIILKFLPYTWTLIERRLKNPIFKNLNLLMHKNLPIKKLKKLKNMKIKHGMVLAAGLGKRMQPLTLNKPKPSIRNKQYKFTRKSYKFIN